MKLNSISSFFTLSPPKKKWPANGQEPKSGIDFGDELSQDVQKGVQNTLNDN